ncbi:MAG: hypothetical protein ABS75_13690 [Pelagibacterium sp. SCN 63-23]|nr:MAG: hypothetical protein ABS75_13690 [Pelagibacterium sp. SCN 63-23]
MAAAGRPDLGDVLALDLICLREPDGSPLDCELHRERLAVSLPKSEWVCLRRDDELIAYGYLWPQADRSWFVGGLAIHPGFRTAPVISELGAGMRDLVRMLGIGTLRSHVLVSNTASLRLHRRLGFAVEMQNERAVAFVANGTDLLGRLPLKPIPPRSG